VFIHLKNTDGWYLGWLFFTEYQTIVVLYKRDEHWYFKVGYLTVRGRRNRSKKKKKQVHSRRTKIETPQLDGLCMFAFLPLLSKNKNETQQAFIPLIYTPTKPLYYYVKI
jgi:hypothetical protein